jgi:CrcB protein
LKLEPYLFVGLGAFLGANLRFAVGGWAASTFGPSFPYGTMLINVTGSFVIGLFLTLIG